MKKLIANWKTVEKIMIVGIILIASLNLFQDIRHKACVFPIRNVFPMNLFMKNKSNMAEMMKSALDDCLRETEEMLRDKKLNISFIEDQSAWDRTSFLQQKNPGICFFYKDEYAQRRYVGFELNKSFGKIFIEDEKSADVDAPRWKKMLAETNNFSQEDYEKIKKEFSGVAYDFNELKVLRSNGIALFFIHSFCHILPSAEKCRFEDFIVSSRNFKISKDNLLNQAAIAYAPYFYERNEELCWQADAMHKGVILFWILSIIFFVPHLFRKGLISALHREFADRNLKMDFRFRFRIELKYWKEISFTIADKKAESIAKKICDDYEKLEDEKRKNSIAEEAKKIGVELEKELGEEEFLRDRYLHILLKMAKGEEKKANSGLAYRRCALNSLEKVLENLKLKREEISREASMNTIAAKPREAIVLPKQAKEKNRIRRQEVLLSNIKNLLPKTCPLVFVSWRNSSLEKMCSVLGVLRGMNNDLVHIFLARPDFRALIEKREDFMEAIRIGRREEVEKILLGNGSVNLVAQEDEVEQEYSLPAELEVEIIAGNRLIKRASMVVEAVKAKGARKVNFYNVDKMTEVIGISKRSPKNRLIVLAYTHHGATYLFQGSKFRCIWVETINVENFASEVARIYHQGGRY